ncbi:MAG: anti-sigma F factor [Lachnospiraceae bacterium]|nr:anti-sigma F factor [Lachnospiraceae bacterium]
MKQKENQLYIEFPAFPENERIARMTAAAFLAAMNPTIEEMDDVKTAVSEAVTNCIIHAYDYEGHEVFKAPKVEMLLERQGQTCYVTITDHGTGIEDIEQAMEPLYTTKPEEERSGMGFSFMEAFMNELKVESEQGKGTKVYMTKRIGSSMIQSCTFTKKEEQENGKE